MQRIYMVLAWFVCLFILSALSYGDGPPDFRQVNWGMGRLAVMAAEESVPEPVSGSGLSYRLWLLGQRVFLGYSFSANRLFEARYVFPEPSFSLQKEVRDILESKYGNPDNKTDHENSLQWQTERTQIRMISGDDGYLRVVYTGREMVQWHESRRHNRMEEKHARLLNQF
ncbi:hypothetical protein OOT00_02030 [Desulfobotulus sp. H1]|uniref:Uncharacterized protein n=1 Tax=Desulfobotulus pelophilus TaxID=2823377 RepID=A0ABT3N6U1_9BACT|nr:hypothetical protein [Desulfobotulus pelophilus]MCW7752762.1 hypothetical protein [Desulfobotulus pelophilus]